MTLALASFFIMPMQPAHAKKQGWLLRQNSQTYGIVKTIVSPDGLKMEMGTIRVTIMPPKWQITFWNERTKFVFSESLQEFRRRSPVKPNPTGYVEKLEPGKPAVQTFSGLKARNWHWYSYDPHHPERQHLLYDFACAENLGLPQGLTDAASICCYIPTGKGLPLRVGGEVLATVVLVPSDLVVNARRAEHVQVAVAVHVRRKHRIGPIGRRTDRVGREVLAAVVLVPGDLVVK
ncbi:MAG TPA: hypothetical protein PKZ32_06820, partial [Candidatus Melainabacteria bacterium]|nr:hypothetical protein [Candidatus Melainabacteria bacterium]